MQLALSIAFDPRWIDHTDLMTSLIKIFCDFFSILPGRFQAGMHLPGLLSYQPVLQMFMPYRIVAEYLVNLLDCR